MMVRHFVFASALLAAGFWGAAISVAQTGGGATGAMPDPMKTVVAKVGEEQIYLAEILAMAEQLPEQYRQMSLPAVYPSLLQRAIDARLVADAGRAAGYSKKPEVKRRIHDAETRIISELYVSELVAKKVTDAALRADYDARKADLAGNEEVKARHILLESEEDARAVIDKLDGGDDFASLASARSTGPSASSGGDLGWFSHAKMVPPFSEAAFELSPGEYTPAPVETRFGWHVILVEDRRDGTVPAFEEIRDELANEASRRLIGALFEDLRRDAVVERFNFDGTPAPDPAKQ